MVRDRYLVAVLVAVLVASPACQYSAMQITPTVVAVPSATRIAQVDRIMAPAGFITPAPRKASVTALAWLNVRAGAGVGEQVIGYLPSGSVVSILGDCDPGGWVRVYLVAADRRVQGWVNSDYLSGGCK